jgi:hypothetical protein
MADRNPAEEEVFTLLRHPSGAPVCYGRVNEALDSIPQQPGQHSRQRPAG